MKNTRLRTALMGCLTLTPAVFGAAAVGTVDPIDITLGGYERRGCSGADLELEAAAFIVAAFIVAAEKGDIDTMKIYLERPDVYNTLLNYPEQPEPMRVLTVVIRRAVSFSPIDSISEAVKAILAMPNIETISPDGTLASRYFADLFYAAIKYNHLPLVQELLPRVTMGELDYVLFTRFLIKGLTPEVRKCFFDEIAKRRATKQGASAEVEEKK